MSRPPDALDEQIRAALGRTPSVAFDADAIVPGIRKRARARRRRRFAAAAAAASTLAVVLFALGLTLRADPGVDVYTQVPRVTETTNPAPWPFQHPPLIDEALPDLPPTPVPTGGAYDFTVEVSEGDLTLSLSDGQRGSESVSGPVRAREYVMGSLWQVSLAPVGVPGSKDVIFGATRPEVDHVVVTVPGGEFRVDTIALDRIPELRFFLIEGPEASFVPLTLPDRVYAVVAYDDHGTIVDAYRGG